MAPKVNNDFVAVVFSSAGVSIMRRETAEDAGFEPWGKTGEYNLARDGDETVEVDETHVYDVYS